MLWFNNKTKPENVPKTYEERLSLLEVELRKVKSENLSLAIDIDTMRNKVLRKIQFKKQAETSEDEDVWGGIPVQ